MAATNYHQQRILLKIWDAASIKHSRPCHLAIKCGCSIKCQLHLQWNAVNSGSFISPLSTAPTQNIGRGLTQRKQHWLICSIACCWAQATTTAVAPTLHEVPLSMASMEHHRPLLLWNTIDRRSVHSSNEVPSAGHIKNTIDCSSYAITLSAAPTTNTIQLNKNSQRHKNKKKVTDMIMAIVNEILWLKMPAMIDVITILYRHHIYDYEYKNACN